MIRLFTKLLCAGAAHSLVYFKKIIGKDFHFAQPLVYVIILGNPLIDCGSKMKPYPPVSPETGLKIRRTAEIVHSILAAPATAVDVSTMTTP